ncbi:hypothetical protein [Halobaculum rubrum]|uniref:hypothetical protein n=1 Tax=Halobaculum rubrum TaxID=2872158 RepID=UPI001CA3F350|nr:hypothetical protein [Halobaculum rubrum]QZX98721.1 hypothetical protein K6T25_10595 [Halobaculum rubrum]
MSLGDLIEAVEQALSTLDELIGGLLSMPTSDDDSGPDNRPPITPTSKAIEAWPTESHRTDPHPGPAFEGHRVPLGGDS